MATILTSAIIESAKSTVSEYTSTVSSLNGEVSSLMNSLSSNFMGDAADGYKEFYNVKIVPAIEENLIGGSSLMSSINTLLDNIQQQLLNTVDPQLGENNRNPG